MISAQRPQRKDFNNIIQKKHGKPIGGQCMNRLFKKKILQFTDWNEDGKTQWWEPLLSLLFILLFWVSIVGAVVFAKWLTT